MVARSTRNYPVAYAAVIVFALVMVYMVTFGSPQGRATSVREDCAAAATASPTREGSFDRAADETIRAFTWHTILRQEPVCGWDLSMEKLRQGQSRESWRDGSLPVVPFPTEYPASASASLRWVPVDQQTPVKADEYGNPELRVFVQVTDGVSVGTYELALVWDVKGFRVGYAQPPFSPPAAPQP